MVTGKTITLRPYQDNAKIHLIPQKLSPTARKMNKVERAATGQIKAQTCEDRVMMYTMYNSIKD